MIPQPVWSVRLSPPWRQYVPVPRQLFICYSPLAICPHLAILYPVTELLPQSPIPAPLSMISSLPKCGDGHIHRLSFTHQRLSPLTHSYPYCLSS
ncbi:hypothetical protein DL93DRAFT_1910587 [Clavulina sp. PMI_390]|nr:hypothetical protein DL93DRAFT_1910587 [Clavulina sp. PMI_390]